MTIIQIEALPSGQHPLQSQSHRTSCWLEGWIEVPSNLESAVWDTLGWCDLTIEDGKLIDIIPTEKPEPVPVEYEPTDMEKLRADVDYISVMTGVDLV